MPMYNYENCGVNIMEVALIWGVILPLGIPLFIIFCAMGFIADCRGRGLSWKQTWNCALRD
jgi:hypothetical protein